MNTVFRVKFGKLGFDGERSLIFCPLQILFVLAGWNTLFSDTVYELTNDWSWNLEHE